MDTPIIELSDDSDIEVIQSTEPLIIPSDDEPLNNDDTDEIQVIGERELPNGDRFISDTLPSLPGNHFHLHLPTGRVLMSHLTVRDRGNDINNGSNHLDRIRVQTRENLHDRSVMRDYNRRQHRLRRQLADSLSRRTFRNSIFTDSTDSDDYEYSPSQSVEIENSDDDDVEIITSIDTPGHQQRQQRENSPATISPLFRIRQMMGLEQRSTQQLPRSENIPPSVMRMIQQEEERLEAKRYKQRKMEMKKVRLEMENNHKIPFNQRNMYTNDFGDGKIGCELCGVQLFVGINDDGPDARKLFNNGFKAPWNGNASVLTDLDKDLSKKAYMAKCGHMYCGRCVHRIRTYLDLSGVEKRKLLQKDKNEAKMAMDMNDGIIPMEIQWKLTKNTAPVSCVGVDCPCTFGKKAKAFYQLFT